MSSTTIPARDTTLMANAIRALAMDAVQKANSGHPGMPMGMAEIAVVLWRRHLRHNPANPHWADRDRFVLSNGHGSMLLYALLHLTGYDLPSRARNFRQLHARRPAIPEVGMTPGIETTTGPLGQGLANAVGMALAEKLLAARVQPPRPRDRRSPHLGVRRRRLPDGRHLATRPLARRHLGLASSSPSTTTTASRSTARSKHWFTDDTPKRFEAYGWNVIADVDGHDVDAVDAAIARARSTHRQADADLLQDDHRQGLAEPAGSDKAHGEALGDKEVAATREALGWTRAVRDARGGLGAWDAQEARRRGRSANGTTRSTPTSSASRSGGRVRAPHGASCRPIREVGARSRRRADEKAETVATRKASQNALEAFAPRSPS